MFLNHNQFQKPGDTLINCDAVGLTTIAHNLWWTKLKQSARCPTKKKTKRVTMIDAVNLFALGWNNTTYTGGHQSIADSLISHNGKLHKKCQMLFSDKNTTGHCVAPDPALALLRRQKSVVSDHDYGLLGYVHRQWNPKVCLSTSAQFVSPVKRDARLIAETAFEALSTWLQLSEKSHSRVYKLSDIITEYNKIVERSLVLPMENDLFQALSYTVTKLNFRQISVFLKNLNVNGRSGLEGVTVCQLKGPYNTKSVNFGYLCFPYQLERLMASANTDVDDIRASIEEYCTNKEQPFTGK